MRYIEVEEEANAIETEIRLVMTTRVSLKRGRLLTDEMSVTVHWSPLQLERIPHEEDQIVNELERAMTRMIEHWKKEQSWRRNLTAVLRRFVDTGKVKRRIANWFTF